MTRVNENKPFLRSSAAFHLVLKLGEIDVQETINLFLYRINCTPP